MGTNYITMPSGTRVYFDHPEKVSVVWSDVAIALSGIRRFGGTVDWTVLQHSLAVARSAQLLGLSHATMRLCALHDLHEAYIGDVVSPLSDTWAALEAAWTAHVHQAFKAPKPLRGDQPRRGDAWSDYTTVRSSTEWVKVLDA